MFLGASASGAPHSSSGQPLGPPEIAKLGFSCLLTHATRVPASVWSGRSPRARKVVTFVPIARITHCATERPQSGSQIGTHPFRIVKNSRQTKGIKPRGFFR